MKIVITENQYNNLVESDLHEDKKEYLSIPKAGCETYVPKKCDPYKYLKLVDGSKTKYFFKKNGTNNWIEAKNNIGINSIQTGVTFNTNPETTLQIKQNLPTQTTTVTSDNKIHLKKHKLLVGSYSYDEIANAVNAWIPKEDNSWGKQVLSSDKEYKRSDWNLNVYKFMNKIHTFRNDLVEKIDYSGLSKTKKDDAKSKLFFLTGKIEDKVELEHEKRWESFFPNG